MSKHRSKGSNTEMSIIEPKINVLLDRTDNDRFLQSAVEIARATDMKPLTLAFNEIARGDVSYDAESL